MEVVLFVVAGGALGLLALMGVTRARTEKRGCRAHPDADTSYLWVNAGSSSSDGSGGDCGSSGSDGGGGCGDGGGGGGSGGD